MAEKTCAFIVARKQKMIKIQHKGDIYIYIFCCLSDTSNFQWFVIWISWINDIGCRKGAVLVCECDVSSLNMHLFSAPWPPVNPSTRRSKGVSRDRSVELLQMNRFTQFNSRHSSKLQHDGYGCSVHNMHRVTGQGAFKSHLTITRNKQALLYIKSPKYLKFPS